MPFSPRVKQLAYADDPACWKSYSGLQPAVKRRMDARRLSSLLAAQRFDNIMTKIGVYAPPSTTVVNFPITNVSEATMQPMKIAMMIHFATTCDKFAPEAQRRSEAYTTFVKDLLRDGMIERPTDVERAGDPGWAYKATDKGLVYVDALTKVGLPVQTQPVWVMPT